MITSTTYRVIVAAGPVDTSALKQVQDQLAQGAVLGEVAVTDAGLAFTVETDSPSVHEQLRIATACLAAWEEKYDAKVNEVVNDMRRLGRINQCIYTVGAVVFTLLMTLLLWVIA